MKKYKYKQIVCAAFDDNESLRQAGEEGWEAYSTDSFFVPANKQGQTRYFLKKVIEE